MRILILGGDGYLGWPTAMRLSAKGHDVAIADNLAHRKIDREIGASSLTFIESPKERLAAWKEVSGKTLRFFHGDLTDPKAVFHWLQTFRPDAVVHFGEQRSAPYSMTDRAHAVYTQHNNVLGTLNLLFAIAEIDPSIHLVKLGTMGEYGTPNIDIEEGFLEIEHNGRRDTLPYPMQPGSWCHLSQAHDSANIRFACRIWGLRATDLHQGIVYGCETDETRLDGRLATRFDYDAVYGTVLNRFIVQAATGHPLTVYGAGGQTRGMLNIHDTLQCVGLALDHPAKEGEYRVFNQFTESFSVGDLAEMVSSLHPGETSIEMIPNPRVEQGEHYYNAKHTKLMDLGFIPHYLSDELITSLFPVAAQNAHRIQAAALLPSVDWRRAKNGVRSDIEPKEATGVVGD